MPVTNYIWDVESDNLLMETDASGATTAVYTNEPDVFGELVSQRRGGASSYYHFDAQRSTRELTDANQNVTDAATYTAFGEAVASSGVTSNPFGYQGALGYYVNPETNDLYVRARFYAAQLGRFCSRDPISYRGKDFNLYRYVGNSPIRRTDPTGKQFVPGTPNSPYQPWPIPPAEHESRMKGCGTGVPGIPLDQLFFQPDVETENLGAWMQVEVYSRDLCRRAFPGEITIDLTFRWVRYAQRQHKNNKYRVTIDGHTIEISEGNDTGETTPVDPPQEWPWPPPVNKISVSQWYAWTGSYTKQLSNCPDKGDGSVEIKVKVDYRAPDGHDMVETATVSWSYGCVKEGFCCREQTPFTCKVSETTGDGK